MSTGCAAGVVNLEGWRSVTNVRSGLEILVIAVWINGLKPDVSLWMESRDDVLGSVVRASPSIPLGVGSATRWSGCWKRTTIGGSPGRTVLSPRPVASNRCRPFRVGRVNGRCRLLQPLQSQSLQGLTNGPRTTCFRSSAGSGNRLSVPLQSGLLQKGSRKISHLPLGEVCPVRVVAGPDILRWCCQA